jgi:hypothetical protein
MVFTSRGRWAIWDGWEEDLGAFLGYGRPSSPLPLIAAAHDYRCPDEPDTTGRTMHNTKNHDTNMTRHDTMDVVSVPARHDGWAVSGSRSQHVVMA